MRSILTIISIFAVLFSVVSQQSVAADSDEAAIKVVNEKQLAAFVSRDYDGEAEVWAHEPYILHASHDPYLVGWEKLGANYKSNFASELDPSFVLHEMTASNYKVHLNGNVAFVFYDQHSEYTEDGERKSADSKSLKYFEKKNGKWRIVAVIPLPSE